MDMIINTMEAFATDLRKESEIMYTFCTSGSTYTSVAFDPPITINSFPTEDELVKKLRGKHGIYIFFVNEAVHLSREVAREWNTISGAKLASNKDSDIAANDCLYVGSCYSKAVSLYTRMKAHYSYDLTASGLQLGDPKREVLKDKVNLIVFPMKKIFSPAQRKLVLPIIEKELHDLLHPKAGVSRT